MRLQRMPPADRKGNDEGDDVYRAMVQEYLQQPSHKERVKGRRLW
jgi:hypothetical protein